MVLVITLLYLVPSSIEAQDLCNQPDSLTILFKAGLYKPMTIEDSIGLVSLPELTLPERYKSPSAPLLPAVLDNSEQPCMRPVFQQTGLCCGQAALVGYNFTYEMNCKREVPGNVPENQYPPHFVYNWPNEAAGYGGVSYYHAMEVLRSVGTPNVADYGGMAAGGNTRWMSGYENYYNGMHNRIENAYNIRTDTYEGFLTLKYWMLEHLNGSPVGGVASFYANQPMTYYLQPGTPEAGKQVCIAWASYSSHALTIVGWNDSIRWDYNSDGQYTNDIDISGDGIINMKDWEIGGFKFVNSYGGIPAWGDSGYCYMMYKTVADKFGEGGIWNSTVNVLKVKEDDSPQLTMKVKVQHTCREQLKIYAGIAEDVSASVPTHILDLPIFDYQGGCLNMQGGSTENDKIIEFGIDISPLLNYITPGQTAKFFLVVVERDPDNWSTGFIKEFSLVDYTNGVNEIPSGVSNLLINQNDTTFVPVVATINYSDVTISTSTLPEAHVYEPYTYQLTATGGTSPYFWDIDRGYNETSHNGTFPSITSEQLTPTSNTDGYAFMALPFEFPFFGQLYDSVYMYVDGFLKFDNWLVTWPYFQEIFYRFTKNRNIAPFFDVGLTLYPSGGDGLWYEGDSSCVTFRWKVSQDGYNSQSDLNLAVKLYPTGKIEYYYGNIQLVASTRWFGGASNGDGKNYQTSAVSNTTSIPNNYIIEFAPKPYPIEMEMSADGVFSGIPEHEYDNMTISFVATDQNLISSSKILSFSTIGIVSDFTVLSGDDNLIEQGETASVDIIVKNISSTTIHNAVMTFSTQDDYIVMTDSTQDIGTLAPNQTMGFPNAFGFIVSDTIENNHSIVFNNKITATEDTFERTLEFIAYAPLITIGTLSIDDSGNGIFDPGETVTFNVTLSNQGKGKAVDIHSILSSVDPQITINNGNDSIDLIPGNGSSELSFTITSLPSTMDGHIAYFEIVITGDYGISIQDTLYLTVGTITEDFETGDFSQFPWIFTGSHQPWYITNSNVYEGSYCARSGQILDQQVSRMKLDIEVLSNSEISFYRRVSSEVNYDFLIFYIDDSEKGRWSGEVPWDKVTYTINKGIRKLKWEYKKDYSVVNGSDCAWVDFITFPPIQSRLLTVYAGADDTICENTNCTLSGSASYYSSILWETTGSGNFSNEQILNPVYYPGTSDIITGAVVLKLTANHNLGFSLTDYMTIFFDPLPEADAGQDISTCEYLPVNLAGQITSSDSAFWSTTGDGTFNDTTNLSAVYYPGTSDFEAGTVNLILTAYPKATCLITVNDTLTLNVQHQPLVNAGDDGVICENQSYQLSGTAEYTSTIQWTTTGDGIFDDPSSLSAIYTPGVEDISAGSVTLALIGYAISPCTGQDSDLVLITIASHPLADAGENQIIPYLTSTTLSCTVSGGSGDYSYMWTPVIYLVNPNIQNPTTVPLTNSVIFTVMVTDNVSGCQSSDQVTVYIEGSPFNITVSANPENVCLGQSTQLNVEVDGVTGPYAYAWTSVPPGFSSDIPNPIDTPLETTTYYITVTDINDNPVEGFITVNVFPPPEADAGEDATTCSNVVWTLSGSASNHLSVQWITYGDGIFDVDTILQASYIPGEQDIINGSVQLELIANAVAPCVDPVSDQVILSFFPGTVVTFNALPDFCVYDPPYLLTEGNPPGGEYSGTGMVDGYFYPSLAGNGTHILTYSFGDTNGCVFSAFQSVLVNPCTGIIESSSDLAVKIIPNPNSGNFIAQIFTGSEMTVMISIYDRIGNMVYEKSSSLSSGENTLEFSLDNQPSSLYLLVIKFDSALITRRVLIYR
ncbi:MAG: T9SS type A sorting domain-containing protein [Bacteroidetes bacterium]|nr:T9SS type A sorting domain-containing protein [Bacteroidota bacterium]